MIESAMERMIGVLLIHYSEYTRVFHNKTIFYIDANVSKSELKRSFSICICPIISTFTLLSHESICKTLDC